MTLNRREIAALVFLLSLITIPCIGVLLDVNQIGDPVLAIFSYAYWWFGAVMVASLILADRKHKDAGGIFPDDDSYCIEGAGK